MGGYPYCYSIFTYYFVNNWRGDLIKPGTSFLRNYLKA